MLVSVCCMNALARVAIATRPNDVLNPNSPMNDAGMRIDPPPSDPCADAQSPLATAAALPPEDPPALRAESKGADVAPDSSLSVVPL